MSDAKAIYKLDWNVGRGYALSGLFVADRADVGRIMGETIDFGEVCGKHSDVQLDMTPEVLTMLTDDQDFIARFVATIGDGTISGHNPLDYCEGDEEE